MFFWGPKCPPGGDLSGNANTHPAATGVRQKQGASFVTYSSSSFCKLTVELLCLQSVAVLLRQLFAL